MLGRLDKTNCPLILCKDEIGNECHKPIEEIQPGDLVWSYDEESGTSDWKEVVQLFRNESSRKTSVKIKAEDGKIDEIVSTPGHMYYLPENKNRRGVGETLEHASYEGLNEKWVSAALLKKGDRVLLANADPLTGKPKSGIVISVKTEECELFTTYNFEVEDFHTYYVGENGVLVHNAGPCELKPGTKEWNQAVKDIQNSGNAKGKLNYTVKDQNTAMRLANEAGLKYQGVLPDGSPYVHGVTKYGVGFEIHPVEAVNPLPHLRFWSGRTNGHIFWMGG